MQNVSDIYIPQSWVWWDEIYEDCMMLWYQILWALQLDGQNSLQWKHLQSGDSDFV